jgi:hypothetical protein
MSQVLPVIGRVLLNNPRICQYYSQPLYLKSRLNGPFVRLRHIYVFSQPHDTDLCAPSLAEFEACSVGLSPSTQIASEPTQRPLHQSVLVERNHVDALNLIYRNKHLNDHIVPFDVLLYQLPKSVIVVCVCVCVCVRMKNRKVVLRTRKCIVRNVFKVTVHVWL